MYPNPRVYVPFSSRYAVPPIDPVRTQEWLGLPLPRPTNGTEPASHDNVSNASKRMIECRIAPTLARVPNRTCQTWRAPRLTGGALR